MKETSILRACLIGFAATVILSLVLFTGLLQPGAADLFVGIGLLAAAGTFAAAADRLILRRKAAQEAAASEFSGAPEVHAA
jgi:hypothetical protein